MEKHSAPSDVKHPRGGSQPPLCAGLTSSALPEVQSHVNTENSQTGVSTRNVQLRTRSEIITNKNCIPHWYALRTTYGREKKASEYLNDNGITVFYPTIDIEKLVNGKRIVVTVSRLPNIFFAYGTEKQIKTFVYDNTNLPYLRFYYRHTHIGNRIEKIPMIVPEDQIESLRIICAADTKYTIVSLVEEPKFKTGQVVRVVDGAFKGVTGIVAKWRGQQRVGVVVEGLATVMTAYVPSAFLKDARYK